MAINSNTHIDSTNKMDKANNDKNMTLPHSCLNDKLYLIETISPGQSTKVKLCYDKEKENTYVVKMIRPNLTNKILYQDIIEKEATSLSKIDHPNVIKYIDHDLQGTFISKKRVNKQIKLPYVVMEYANKGDLFDFLKVNKGFYIKVARYYFKQLINAISACHDKNICHRDIKIENLLLDDKFNLKLCDFGFATEIKDNKSEFISLQGQLGTSFYMAPEMYFKRGGSSNDLSRHRGDQVDIFSSGVVLYVLITGKFPFSRANTSDSHFKYLYTENEKDKFWQTKNMNFFPLSAKELVSKMLTPNPDERITIEEIKKSKFYNEDIPDEKEIYNYMYNIWLMTEMMKKKIKS